jgi:type I restriction enzyme R subunit
MNRSGLLSERLQRLIDEKRAGTLAGVALIEELEKVTDAVRQAIDEVNRPIAQQLALKVKARNAAIVQVLRRRHYKPGTSAATGDDSA